jgi:Flp pilus assembly protein TadG
MFQRWTTALSRFAGNKRGSVAVIFGGMSVAFLLAGGLAVDYARIVDMRERLTTAADSASQAAGRAMREGRLTDIEVLRLAEASFEDSVARARNVGTIEAPSIIINRAAGSVSVDVTAVVAMTVSRIGGVTEMTVPVTSTAVYR